MGRTIFFAWEVALMQAIQANGNMILEKIAVFFTLFGEDLAMLFVVGLFFWGFSKRIGKEIAMTFLGSLLVGCMAKNVIMRRRPYMDHESVKCLRAPSKDGALDDIVVQGYSCPSLHANDSLTIYGTILLHAKKHIYKVLLLILIVMVGFSRVYLGVHYPTDILAGWSLGLLGILLIGLLRRKVKNDLVVTGVLAIVYLPGWFFCSSTDFYSAYGLLLGMGMAFWFEENYVNFSNTTNPLEAVLRTIIGVMVFFVISSGLKILFASDIFESQLLIAHIVRTGRYAIGIFVATGIYPVLFKRFHL